MTELDIHSGTDCPVRELSNFTAHPFVFDGVRINSFEGFLQSLKFNERSTQSAVCKLEGKAAMLRGRPMKWQTDQMLYWKGMPYKRDSTQYRALLERVYKAMFDQSATFREALLATGDARLTHTMGGTKQTETVLTQTEFCSILMNLRDEDRNKK